MDESKEIKIFGSRWSGFVDNKNGPWKFGDKMWSFPMPLSVIEGMGSSK